MFWSSERNRCTVSKMKRLVKRTWIVVEAGEMLAKRLFGQICTKRALRRIGEICWRSSIEIWMKAKGLPSKMITIENTTSPKTERRSPLLSKMRRKSANGLGKIKPKPNKRLIAIQFTATVSYDLETHSWSRALGLPHVPSTRLLFYSPYTPLPQRTRYVFSFFICILILSDIVTSQSQFSENIPQTVAFRPHQHSPPRSQHRTRDSLIISPPIWLLDPELLPVTERSSLANFSLVRSVLGTRNSDDDDDDDEKARVNFSQLTFTSDIAEDSDIFIVGSDSDTEDSHTSFCSDMSSFETDPDPELAYLGFPDKSSFPCSTFPTNRPTQRRASSLYLV